MKQSPFESIKHLDSHGQEFWSARELSKALKYSQWRNFETAIEKAKISCESA
jgi:DNA-damage-inducible protein D